jgi:hypothetical protein
LTTTPTAPVAIAVARPAPGGGRLGPWVARLVVLGLCTLHTWAAVVASGGPAEVSSEWPLAIHDHPIYYHCMRTTPEFLRRGGTTAGYDPSFMAGYAKSMWFPQSSTFFDVVGLLGRRWPTAPLQKWTVLVATAALPWLATFAAAAWRLRASATAWGLALLLTYVWTDGGGAGFPLGYAGYGMVAYWLAVPMALLTSATIAGFLRRGGFRGWLAVVWLASLTWMVHITSPMLVGPSALAAYVAAIVEGRALGRPLPRLRHLGLWLALPIVAALNAFWWWPGWFLASTSDGTVAALANAEPVLTRLNEIATTGPPIQAVLAAGLLPGLVVLARRDRVASASLLGFAAAGFGWGYLAGASRALDVLQPGRHTYGFYAASALAAGIALGEVGRLARPGRGRLDLWILLGLGFVGLRFFGPELAATARYRLGFAGAPPFLSSRPTPRLRWILEQVRRHVPPGERLLYEEAGLDLPGVPDPYSGGRYSGLLPHLAGVEVIGGPYLKAALKTNFTQFGGGLLFGEADWDEASFRRHARLYRPAAILCWSPRAVAFCREHPELIDVLAEDRADLAAIDPRTGRPTIVPSVLVFGRVKGFEGDAIVGRARVAAKAGRLVVRGAVGDELDGRVVLRYHSVPHLRADPPVRLESVEFPDDPVPFIGFRPPPGAFAVELDLPP